MDLAGPDLTAAASAVIALFIRAAAILAATWLLACLARRRSSAVRHAIWSAGLIAALCAPLVQAILPPIPIIVPWLPALGAPATTELRTAVGAAGSVEPTSATSLESGSNRTVAVTSWVGTARKPGAFASMSGGLLALWAVGAASRMGWLGLLLLRTRRISRRGRQAGAEVEAMLLAALRTIAAPPRVRAVVSEDVSMPLTWGLVRPVIALPVEVGQWPPERVRVALLHELAHVCRRDYPISLAAELAAALYWPIPFVWFARERLRVEQERACDDVVLSSGTPAIEYAEHLLAVARSYYGSRATFAMTLAMARRVTLKHRVQVILDREVDRRPLHAGVVARTAAGVGLAAIPLSLVTAHGSPTKPHPPSGQPVAESPAATPVPDVPASAPLPAFAWVEAEHAVRDGTESLREDLDASGAAYVVLRQGSDGASLSELALQVEVESPGEYRLWARLRADGDDRIEIGLDGTPLRPLDSSTDNGEGGDWTWRLLGTDESLSLKPGSHTVRLAASSGTVRIDRLLLTSDSTFQPRGRGPLNADLPLSHHLLDAESADLAGRLRHGDDRDAIGGGFLVFRSRGRNERTGSALFRFTLEQPGRYLVWGRATARDEDSNSFFATIDDGEEMVWDIAISRDERGDPDWHWEPLSARRTEGRTIDPFVVDLSAGTHTLRLRTREAGVRLDAIFITNDLSRRPSRILAESPSVALQEGIAPESGERPRAAR